MIESKPTAVIQTAPVFPSEYLNTKEAAQFLRTSPRTLEKWRVTGAGPEFFKIGRLAFYSPVTLRAWVEGNRRRSTSDKGGAA
ncbi:MAG: helix-turn-helix domain-containing protein [Syntrophobacteraceae bacterium]|jgi:hypothetical protein